MNKKRRWLVVLLIIAVFTILVNYYLSLPKSIVFSNDPKDWIDKNNEITEVNVNQVSKGKSHIDNLGQQFNDYEKEIRTSFKQEGFYKGNYFTNSYSEKNKEVMKITNKINPNNGIIEGYILEIIEDKPIVYIFLDQDWKEKIGETNIFWGINFANEKRFDFEEISKGIYMNKIIDDANRFSNNFTIHTWGVIVGDLTKDNDVNKTLIKLV